MAGHHELGEMAMQIRWVIATENKAPRAETRSRVLYCQFHAYYGLIIGIPENLRPSSGKLEQVLLL